MDKQEQEQQEYEWYGERKVCRQCKGKGPCWLCNGKGYYDVTRLRRNERVQTR